MRVEVLVLTRLRRFMIGVAQIVMTQIVMTQIAVAQIIRVGMSPSRMGVPSVVRQMLVAAAPMRRVRGNMRPAVTAANVGGTKMRHPSAAPTVAATTTAAANSAAAPPLPASARSAVPTAIPRALRQDDKVFTDRSHDVSFP